VAPSAALSRLESILRRVARDLDDLGRRWALVGALAVSARAEPRFTRDIDLVVAVTSDDDAERLVRELQGRRYRAQAIVEQEATRRLATARLLPAGEDETGVVVDVLFASSGIEAEIASEADTVEVPRGPLRVVRGAAGIDPACKPSSSPAARSCKKTWSRRRDHPCLSFLYRIR
jgi:Nucleotidyl transferase AbiEii toxin, Type IV TA system